MLQPEDRKLYTSCFTVPEGYRFDCGIGTTFTLDLETLLFVPIALTSSGSEDPRAALADRVALLGAIHRVAERLTVFCEDGRSNAPSLQHSLIALLEESFVPVRAPASRRDETSVFHPKLWLFRFEHRETRETLVRAVVLSRNVTTSRCWDTVVQLEGTPYPSQIVSQSKPLANLVRALPALVSQTELRPSSERLRQLDMLATLVERTPFAAPAPFDQKCVEFVTLGLADGQRWKPQPGNRVMGVSPFLSERALATLAALGSSRTLISRVETLDVFERSILREWSVFGLHDAAGADAESAESELGDTVEVAPHGLHAKALVIESGKRTTWWLGSANLTDPVMSSSNVELLIRLEGRTKQVGIDAFLAGGFQELLRAYDLKTQKLEESAEDRAERLVERAQRAVINADLKGGCEPLEDGSWELVVAGEVALPSGVRVEAYPLTLAPVRALSLNSAPLRFSKLPMEALTAFLALRVEATVNECTVRSGFTCRIPVTGLPAERFGRIVRSVLESRDSLLGYLQRLLDDVQGPVAASTLSRARRGFGAGRAAQEQPVLLESIVRALRRSPDRLLAIDQTLRRLRQEQGEGHIIPDELATLWDAVRDLVLMSPTSDCGV